MDELELELQKLRPRAPQADLTRRIERELAPTAVVATNVVHVPRWRWCRPLAAVAAVLLIALGAAWLVRPWGETHEADASGSRPVTASEPSPGPALERVAQVNYLLNAQDHGVVFVSDHAPFRKVRCQYLDASEWRDPEGDLTFEILVPREEVMLMPVRIY